MLELGSFSLIVVGFGLSLIICVIVNTIMYFTKMKTGDIVYFGFLSFLIFMIVFMIVVILRIFSMELSLVNYKCCL